MGTHLILCDGRRDWGWGHPSRPTTLSRGPPSLRTPQARFNGLAARSLESSLPAFTGRIFAARPPAASARSAGDLAGRHRPTRRSLTAVTFASSRSAAPPSRPSQDRLTVQRLPTPAAGEWASLERRYGVGLLVAGREAVQCRGHAQDRTGRPAEESAADGVAERGGAPSHRRREVVSCLKPTIANFGMHPPFWRSVDSPIARPYNEPKFPGA